MYTHFYHLATYPFNRAPEPDFCFSHAGYKRARECLDLALARGEGILLLTGQLGAGKTLLVGMFLKEIDTSEVLARRIVVSGDGPPTLLHAVAYTFGIDTEGVDKGAIRQRIQQFFMRQEQSGRRVLLIIDEAQNLSHAAMEELSLLANMQTQSRPMLQLFFIGQESLQDLMCTVAMEPFQRRVIANHRLEPLSLRDTRSYIAHRLLKAGWKGDPEFSGAAVLKIYQISKGLPRQINKICRRLLLLGFGKDNHTFDEQDVLEISAELHNEGSTPLETSQSPVYDTGNITNIPEIRDKRVSVTDLAIRVINKDASGESIAKSSWQAAQDSEEFIERQYTPPAICHEYVTLPDIKTDAAAAVKSESLHASNKSSHAAMHHSHNVAKVGQNDRLGWKKILAIAAVLLVLLTIFIASVPSFPGRDGIKNMLPFRDYIARWSQQPDPLQERPEVVVPDVVDVNNDLPVVDANNQHPKESEVPLSVVDTSVRATTVTEIIEQDNFIQSAKIENLLAQGRVALDEYRLTTPESDNAYEYLLAVLQLDPENEKARAGIQEIVDAYITLVVQTLNRNETERAERYLDRGLFVEPNNPELLTLKDTINSKNNSVPVTPETTGAQGQLTRENTRLQKKPAMFKRQSADRYR